MTKCRGDDRGAKKDKNKKNMKDKG